VRRRAHLSRATGASDLAGLWLTLGLAVGFLAILAVFFFVGPVVGLVVLLAAVVLAILGVVAVVRRAEEPSD
jgi:membrane protein implicated in regulation of membrane protease activity